MNNHCKCMNSYYSMKPHLKL